MKKHQLLLFLRFTDCGVFYDNHDLDGVLSLFRVLLLKNYRTYNEDGFEVFKGNEPVIYYNTPSMFIVAQYLCHCVSNLSAQNM